MRKKAVAQFQKQKAIHVEQLERRGGLLTVFSQDVLNVSFFSDAMSSEHIPETESSERSAK